MNNLVNNFVNNLETLDFNHLESMEYLKNRIETDLEEVRTRNRYLRRYNVLILQFLLLFVDFRILILRGEP